MIVPSRRNFPMVRTSAIPSPPRTATTRMPNLHLAARRVLAHLRPVPALLLLAAPLWGAPGPGVGSTDIIVYPAPAAAGQTVTLDGSASTLPGGPVTAYHWEWQDEGKNFERGGTGAQIHTTWSQPGEYRVHLWTENAQGQRGDAWITVVIHANTLPTGVPRVTPNPVKVGQAVTLDGSASSDPDGPIGDYLWQWQDEGKNFNGLAWGVQAQATWTQPGTYEVDLMVRDLQGGQTNTRTSVTVAAAVAPTPAPLVSPTVTNVGVPVTLDASSSYSPEGPIATYQWMWQAEAINGVKQWVVSWGPTATVTWSQPGQYQVHLSVWDAQNRHASAGVVVDVYSPGTPLQGNCEPPQDLPEYYAHETVCNEPPSVSLSPARATCRRGCGKPTTWALNRASASPTRRCRR